MASSFRHGGSATTGARIAYDLPEATAASEQVAAAGRSTSPSSGAAAHSTRASSGGGGQHRSQEEQAAAHITEASNGAPASRTGASSSSGAQHGRSQAATLVDELCRRGAPAWATSHEREMASGRVRLSWCGKGLIAFFCSN